MGTSQSSRGTVRFGVFEVDVQSAELHKQGAKVKLQEQPFQILQTLLEHPGEVVTRDELRGSGRPTRLLTSSKVFTTPSSGCARRLVIRPKHQATSRRCPRKVIVSLAALKPAHHALSRWPSCPWKISPAIPSKSTSPKA